MLGIRKDVLLDLSLEEVVGRLHGMQRRDGPEHLHLFG